MTPADTAVAGPTPGCYQHYKGQFYEVLGEAAHTETGESFVVYKSLYGDFDFWLRPTAMFVAPVVISGQEVPRFSRVQR